MKIMVVIQETKPMKIMVILQQTKRMKINSRIIKSMWSSRRIGWVTLDSCRVWGHFDHVERRYHLSVRCACRKGSLYCQVHQCAFYASKTGNR